MKKNLASLVALVGLVGLFMVSCNKEQLTGNGTQFRATMEQCAKTALDGTALNWVDGDQITVYGTAGSGLYSATPQTPATTAIFDNVSGEPGDAPYRAYYPSTLTTNGTTVTLPATQTYVEGSISGFPMYAESNDNQLAFKNLCGVLKLHLTKANTSITQIAITAVTEINGQFTIDNTGDAPALTYSANGTRTTRLTCATAQSITEGKDFYIYLPTGSYSGLQIEMNTDDNHYCIKTSNTAIVIERSAITTVTLGSTLDFSHPVGSLGGLFTINADGDRVWFSQGNLHYQASTGTWRFADHQNGYVGLGGDIVDASYTGWIDHFGWGTGANPTLSTYNNNDYSTYVEWGTNAISNGGDQANAWRTLTASEWDYIVFSRTDASNRYGSGCVNGVNGLILLPDDWTLPNGCGFNPGMNGGENNNYMLSEWMDMEAAGAVFLPAGGGRWPENETVVLVGSQGSYWSSTPHSGDSGRARGFGLGMTVPRELAANDGSQRCCLFMVRLVQDYVTD